MQNYDFLITYCTLAYNLFKKHKKKAAITAAFFRYRSLPLIPQGEKINHPVGKSSSPLGGGWEGL